MDEDVYWSIEHCGWVRCPRYGDPLRAERPEPEVLLQEVLPVQRTDEQVPAES